MSRNIRIVFLILTLILIFFSVMIWKFYNNVDVAVRTDDMVISSESGNASGLSVFRADSGLKGIRTESGQIVIPAKWSGITGTSSGKFIVSHTDGQQNRYGVIDISENIIIPVIYSRILFEQQDSVFVCSTEDDGYILLDENGRALCEREWTSYKKKNKDKALSDDGNYIELENGNDVFRVRSRDGRLSVMYIKMIRELCEFEKHITVRNVDKNLSFRDTPDCYYQLVDNAVGYILAMFGRDPVQVDKLVSSDFRGLQNDEVDFVGGELRYFDTIWPFIEYKDGAFSYSCRISLMYAVPDTIDFDGSFTRSYKVVTFNIRMRREQDGFLRIISVTADEADISDFDIPAECFDPEDVPETSEDPEVTIPEVSEIVNEYIPVTVPPVSETASEISVPVNDTQKYVSVSQAYS